MTCDRARGSRTGSRGPDLDASRVGTFRGQSLRPRLLLYCYRMVLFAGEQFAFRDAIHFYYPLYLRVQQEWEAGRWPLWDPGQNGGIPLLGYPMAAVLYPGKIVYALMPFPWAHRLYVIAHTVAGLRRDARPGAVAGHQRGGVVPGRAELCVRGARSCSSTAT